MTEMLPWTLLIYDVERWPFSTYVAESLEVEDLTSLSADLPRRTWQTDQQSPWHAAFYAGFERWRNAYERFIRVVIRQHVEEPFYYQAVPTFRVHLPGNLAVGEFHTDAKYHHPRGEVNFWVPLTAAEDTSSVFIEADDHRVYAPTVTPGDVVIFSAVDRLHGNFVNQTGQTRVSFDFRVMPLRLMSAVAGQRTEHTKLRFVPGEYYATEVVVP